MRGIILSYLRSVRYTLRGIRFLVWNFVECEFVDFDLSMVILTESMFQEVKFSGCKMLGLFFESAKPFLFQVSFDQFNLASTSFAEVNMQNTSFKDCKMVGVDFTEANLSNTVLKVCDLSNATFQNKNLSKTDLRLAQNFSIDIYSNHVKNVIVLNINLEGFVKGLGG